LKICPRNRYVSHRRRRPVAAILAAACLLALQTCVPQGCDKSKSAAKPSPKPSPQAEASPQSELAALQALMKVVETKLDRPLRVSATHVSRIGYWEKQDFKVAWLGLMRQFLPTVRNAHPELIAYWLVRTEEDAGFGSRASTTVGAVPELLPWSTQLQSASEALVREARQASGIRSSLAPEEELGAMRRALDLEGKRSEVIKVVKGILDVSGELDPERNPRWRPVYQFLKQDADEQWSAASEDRNSKRDVAVELRKVFVGALNPPVPTLAYLERLQALESRLESARPQLLESALSPQQTPEALVDGGAGDSIDVEIAFDQELTRALDSAELRANPSLMRLLDGLYPVWESLDRYEAFLRAGRKIQSVSLLMETARTVLLAESWESNDIDVNTGKSTREFIVERAGETLDLLTRYRSEWRERAAPPQPLYAAVAVDESGERLWSHLSWICWKWMATADLDDLASDGRVVEAVGRRWLLPAGSRSSSIQSLRDVQATGAMEIVVALDPSGSAAGTKGAAP
jgi:hypothetical protein